MSFYTSLNGLKNAQTDLGVIAHNIANVETTGFKRSRVDFSDIVAGSAYSNPKLIQGIGATVEAVSIPVIANGNIATAADAREALRLSGAAGVMIGRAAQGKPWHTAAIARALRSGGEAVTPPPSVIIATLLALYDDVLSFYGEALGARIARKHIAWAIDGCDLNMAPDLRRATRSRICQMTTEPRRR